MIAVVSLSACEEPLLEQSPEQSPEQIPENSVSLPQVVSLAPHITEVIFALGAQQQLIATVSGSHWPQAAQDIPTIGNAFNLNVEALAALAPDAVLAWREGTGVNVQNALVSTGLPVHYVREGDLPQLPEQWGIIAGHLGLPADSDRLQHLQTEFINELQQLKPSETALTQPQYAIFLLSENPYYVVGGQGLLAQALTWCGWNNRYAEIRQPAFAISQEQLQADSRGAVVLTNVTSRSAMHTQFSNTQIIHSEDLYRAAPSMLNGLRELCGLRESAAVPN